MGKIGINMSGLLKRLSFQTGQSRKVTYYRPPVYGKDNYGVETDTISAQEIIVPDVRAYIHNKSDKSFVQQRAGHNVTGKANIYLPNLGTLKNFPNFSGATAFNEPEGFDKIIDYDRTVYQVPTDTATGWSGTGSAATDGESVTLTASGDGNLFYATTANNNLEADRITMQIKGSGSVQLNFISLFHGGTADSYRVKYDNANFILLDETYLTIDLPFASGTTSTSIYQTGSRNAVTLTEGADFDYLNDFRKLQINFNADNGDTITIKNIKYYKSAEWSIHEINDYNDEFMSLSCVRTEGRRDSRRRAYGTAYNRP
jgi:hypothetical protein